MYRGLSAVHQKKLLKGEWRLRSLTGIGRSAGLHDVYAKAFYSYLCGYAHAGNLSVLQMRQADTAEFQRSLCASSMNLVLIAMARMVQSYCAVFPKAMDRLSQEPEGAGLVKVWVGFGSTAPTAILE